MSGARQSDQNLRLSDRVGDDHDGTRGIVLVYNRKNGDHEDFWSLVGRNTVGTARRNDKYLHRAGYAAGW
jgi:hypothetical protein